MFAEWPMSLALAALLTLATPLCVSAAGADDEIEGPLVAVTDQIDAGDYAGAIAALQKLLAEDPNDADVLNLLGYSHRLSGDLSTLR